MDSTIGRHPVFRHYPGGYDQWVINKTEEDINLPDDYKLLEEDLRLLEHTSEEEPGWVEAAIIIPTLFFFAVIITLLTGAILTQIIEAGGEVIYRWFLA